MYSTESAQIPSRFRAASHATSGRLSHGGSLPPEKSRAICKSNRTGRFQHRCRRKATSYELGVGVAETVFQENKSIQRKNKSRMLILLLRYAASCIGFRTWLKTGCPLSDYSYQAIRTIFIS